MYRHIEKEEKKLTDEEIVKALEDCNRGYTDMNRNSCDTCPYRDIEPCGKAQMTGCIDLIHRLQAEIERLTEYNANLNGMNLEFIDKNAELQKQVDELKSRLWASENAVKEMSNAFGRERARVDKAVKDTAKEITSKVVDLIMIYDDDFKLFLNNFELWVKEHYGVDVE
jgi:chromosome segregation ATPase